MHVTTQVGILVILIINSSDSESDNLIFPLRVVTFSVDYSRLEGDINEPMFRVTHNKLLGIYAAYLEVAVVQGWAAMSRAG